MKTLYITLVLIIGAGTFLNAQNTTANSLSKIMFEAKITQLQEQTIEMAAMEDAAMIEKLKVKTAPSIEELYETLSKQVAATFSESEMSYLIDFYKSPVGKKILETSKTFNGVTNSTIQDWQLSLDEVVMHLN